MSMLRRAVQVCLLVGVLVTAVDASAASASTFFVNGSTGNNANPCTSAGAPCKTIGAAITKSELAPDAATIEVAAGVYTEELLLVSQGDTGLTINGAGSGPSGTVIEGPGTSPAAVAVPPNEGSATFNHLSMVIASANTAPALVAIETSPTLNDVTIDMRDSASTEPAIISEKTSSTLNHVTVEGSWHGPVLVGIGSLAIANSTLLSNASALILVTGEKGGHTDLIRDSTVRSSSAATNTNVLASGVNLTVDSSLLLGGNPYDIEWVQTSLPKPRVLTVAGSTLDAGTLGSDDPLPVSDIFAGSEGVGANARIEGSILADPQTAIIAKSGDEMTATCVDSDVPNQKQAGNGSTTGSINCANGENGNTSSTPASLFVAPGSNYQLNPSSTAVDSVPAGAISLPFGLAPSTTDLAGNPRVVDGNGDCVPVQDKGAFELQGHSAACPGPPPAKPIAGAITGLTISPSSFFAAPSGATISKAGKSKKTYGATVGYGDSQVATTTFTVLGETSGRIQGKSCKKPSKSNKHGKHCTIYTAIGSFTHTDTAGANKLHFSGRLKGKKLAKGSYRLQAVPHNAAGNGKAVSGEFKIK
jgi:hypothetical protein